jgi:hypothetical protein
MDRQQHGVAVPPSPATANTPAFFCARCSGCRKIAQPPRTRPPSSVHAAVAVGKMVTVCPGGGLGTPRDGDCDRRHVERALVPLRHNSCRRAGRADECHAGSRAGCRYPHHLRAIRRDVFLREQPRPSTHACLAQCYAAAIQASPWPKPSGVPPGHGARHAFGQTMICMTGSTGM